MFFSFKEHLTVYHKLVFWNLSNIINGTALIEIYIYYNYKLCNKKSHEANPINVDIYHEVL